MKNILLIVCAILISTTINAQDITGSWNGILKIQGTQLRLIFNISKTEKGYTSTMDSPDQGAKGISVTSTKFENSVLEIKLTNIGITYEGTLNKENTFVGTFKQSGLTFPLNLSKEKSKKEKIVRPQEPSKPYPYYSEEVTFNNKADNITLSGTLTLPKKDGNFPAVILITGSGAQNRDEELMGHKPFLVLSDYLTKKGIAVLRFDDRGTAKSTGNFKPATTADFARDVESALKYLKSRKEINHNKIGLIGHSEGGIIAPIVASKNKSVDFIILLAGTGIRGDKLLLLQQEEIGSTSGISEKDLSKARVINKGAFDIVLKTKDIETLKKELTNYLKESLKDQPKSEIPKGTSIDDYVQLQVKQLTSPWMIYFIKYNPATILEKVKCPVFAINGNKDLQVSSKVNLPAIKKALIKGGNKSVTTKELANLNHLFQECETGLPSEYSTIEQTFSPIALEEISNWILKQVK